MNDATRGLDYATNATFARPAVLRLFICYLPYMLDAIELNFR